MNPNVLAAIVGLAGVAAAVASMLGIHQFVVLNYRHADVIEFGVRQLGTAAGFYLLGAYVAGHAARRRRAHGAVPIAMAVASLVGAVLVLVPLVWVSESLQATLRWPAGAIGAWAGARLAAFWQREETAVIPWGRVLPIAVVLLGLAVAPLLGQAHAFPGDEAPPMARRIWAEQTFGRHYGEALTFVQEHPEVRRRLGRPTAVAPIAGSNAVWYWQGKTHALFTLAIEGPHGRGVAHIRADFPTSEASREDWPFRGTLLVGDEPAIGL